MGVGNRILSAVKYIFSGENADIETSRNCDKERSQGNSYRHILVKRNTICDKCEFIGYTKDLNELMIKGEKKMGSGRNNQKIDK